MVNFLKHIYIFAISLLLTFWNIYTWSLANLFIKINFKLAIKINFKIYWKFVMRSTEHIPYLIPLELKCNPMVIVYIFDYEVTALITVYQSKTYFSLSCKSMNLYLEF